MTAALQPYAYPLDHVRELRDVALSRLSAPEAFRSERLVILHACYNGIGPDRWSTRFRGFVTWVLGFFEADALIHDYEYSLPQKSYWLFTVANLRFAFNSVVLAAVRFGVSRKTAKVAALGLLLALLCQFFGYSGYKTGSIPTTSTAAPDHPTPGKE